MNAEWPLVVRAGFGRQLHAGRVRIDGIVRWYETRCGIVDGVWPSSNRDAEFGPSCRRCLKSGVAR